jgi:hypothetical protein
MDHLRAKASRRAMRRTTALASTILGGLLKLDHGPTLFDVNQRRRSVFCNCLNNRLSGAS